MKGGVCGPVSTGGWAIWAAGTWAVRLATKGGTEGSGSHGRLKTGGARAGEGDTTD